MSNGKAPVCPVSRSQAVPGMPGLRKPPIPPVTDLPSALQALTQINLILPQLMLPGMVINNVFPPLPFGTVIMTGNDGPNQDGGGGMKLKKQHWKERDRNVQKMRCQDPDEEANFVMIDVVLSLTLEDGRGNYITLEF